MTHDDKETDFERSLRNMRFSNFEVEAIVKISSSSPDPTPLTDLSVPPFRKTSSTIPDSSTSVTLGTTTDRQYLRIGDLERRNGLYILGKPRMGKSWLIVNMILQDIEKGNGIFFIDPHGDAIDEILSRRAIILGHDSLLLEPDNPSCSCGINILACPDITDAQLRADTFARVKGFFDKIWKNTFEDRPWLQLILQNTIYAFIENPAFTLAEFPMFFRNREFRQLVVGNIKYNDFVRHYWLKTFASKTKHDQDAQMEAAQTRLEILLAHPTVRHIVGQQKSTIDFGDALKSNKIVLLKLSSAMSTEDKKFIGTLFVSELLSAIQKRTADNRTLFCIYIDEFQNFASFEDFATLITQAPKFGITTTLAHHDRYGQLGDKTQIIGATAAIANKVLFQLTGKDAHDCAPELRNDPPTEMRDEDIYIISQHPFYDLIHGHRSPDVRSLVDRYIRPIKERLEDIYGDRETERLIRTDYLDEASLYRIDERIEATLTGDVSLQRGVLGGAAREISKAKSQTDKLKQLNEEGILIRATIRMLNRVFIDMMEGKLDRGQEEFSNKLIEISKAAILPDEDRRILELYIAYAYGECGRVRILPFELAKRQGLFKEHVEKVGREINDEAEAKKARFAKRIWDAYNEHINTMIQYTQIDYDRLNAERKSKGDWYYRIEDFRDEERRKCEDAIYEYNNGAILKGYYTFYQNYSRGMYHWINEIAKTAEPLIIRKPADIALRDTRIMRVSADIYELSMRKDLTTRGYSGIVESIDGLANLCEYLAKPENLLEVKTRQRTQKEVPTRTVADMVNEMEGELTELPKYTAHAKVLQGKNMWKGRITTLPLPKNMFENLGMPMFIPSMYPAIWKERSWIESEIQRRQIEWKQNKPAQGTEKPVPSKGKPSKPGKPPTDEPPPIRY